MARYNITHKTEYSYSFPAGVSAHLAHLHPRISDLQTCHRFDLDIFPRPTDLTHGMDYYGNHTHYFSIQELHESLVVTATSDVTVQPQFVPDAPSTATCQQVRKFIAAQPPETNGLAEEYIYSSRFAPTLPEAHAFAKKILRPEVPILEASINLCHAIYASFEFEPTATELSTPVSEVFKLRKGVCQDFAHLMLTCFRAHGLPALYVSGYILTQPPPGQPRLIGADASHAWVSVFVPEVGWIDLDPTNNKVVTDEHITVARGRDYSDVSPIRGEVVGGGKHELEIEVTVIPFNELPDDHFVI